ncbi:MAG: nucleotide exchange factor GrpE [Verrucomicrobia bacterium]|nr:nucleotide exchange factor GrpE [Verrucomicrobiota bacterium]
MTQAANTDPSSESIPSGTASAEDPQTPINASPEELDALKAKALKADEHWANLLRTTADFENYKKRAARERQEAIKYAAEGVLERLIPVLDNFDMAMLASQAQGADLESLRTGVNMIQQQLKTALSEAGLEEVHASGQLFDPNLHEAVSQQPSADVPEGHVIQQLRKGYRLKDRLLRPATVVVAQKPSAE